MASSVKKNSSVTKRKGYQSEQGEARARQRSAESSWDEGVDQPRAKPKRTGKKTVPSVAPESSADAERSLAVYEHLSGGLKAQRNAVRDDRLTLNVTVMSNSDDEFDVLVDGKAYWGGNGSDYKGEMRLHPGEHVLRVRQRHPLDKQPSSFVPLIAAIWFMDGQSSAGIGPFFAALDAKISIAENAKLTVKFTKSEPAADRPNGRVLFSCSAGKGMTCEIVDASIASTPSIRRRWRMGNYLPLALATLFALCVTGLGVYMGARPGGSLLGGLLVGLMGAALFAGCTYINGRILSALNGVCVPDVDIPKPRTPRKPKPEPDVSGSQAEKPDKPVSKRGGSKPKLKGDNTAVDYEGAYDDVSEMDEFEHAQISAAGLTPEQLAEAKKKLLKKLGASEDSV